MRESQQVVLPRRLHKLLPTSSRLGAVPPIQDGQPRGPLHVCVFILSLSPSSFSLLQETILHAQPRLRYARLPHNLFACYQPSSPVISIHPKLPRLIFTRELQQPVFPRRLHKLLPTSSRSNTVPPTQDGQPRSLLPVCLFILSLPSSSFSLLQQIPLHSQPQQEHAGLPHRFFDRVSLQCDQQLLPV
jgi:hypothetical protein